LEVFASAWIKVPFVEVVSLNRLLLHQVFPLVAVVRLRWLNPKRRSKKMMKTGKVWPQTRNGQLE